MAALHAPRREDSRHMTTASTILAVDIGGTFTDLFALDLSSQRIHVRKLLTTNPDPSVAVLQGDA